MLLQYNTFSSLFYSINNQYIYTKFKLLLYLLSINTRVYEEDMNEPISHLNKRDLEDMKSKIKKDFKKLKISTYTSEGRQSMLNFITDH